MDMRRLLPFAVLLAAHIPVAGDSEPPDLFDADVLTVRSVEPLTNGQTRIDVSASAGIAGGLSVTGAVEFLQGIAYVAPAPDLSMGPFTNVGWTAAGTPCPEWWTAHAVIDAEAAPNDFAAVTQGQVKWLAHSAALSFAEAEVPGGTHAADIVALVGSFTPSNNALPATLGQLKAAAAPFWALLEETWWWYELPFGWRPWTGESPQDFALANVGQAKNAFFFNLPPLYMTNTDFDGDGVPDGHERFLYGTDGDFWDTDGDGLSDGEEIARGTNPLVRDTDGDGYADGTDPDPFAATPWTDADGDGFPDAWRGFWFGTNVIVSASDDTNTNGISNLASLLMGVNPVASPASGFASECGDASDWFVAWEIVPSAFAFLRPTGLSNLITRTFRVDRVSPWQQIFISSRAIGAAGWMTSDVSIRYGIDGGPVTNLIPATSADSWRIPLGPGPVTNLTFVVEATGDAPSLSRPLHLIRWSPHVELVEDDAGRFLPVEDGKAPLFLSRRRAESGWYVVPVTTSLEWMPHVGGVDAEMAAELALPPMPGLSVTNGSERAILAIDPVWAELPPEGANPAVRICCWELEHETPGEIGSGPRTSRFDSPYPLSSPALRKAFHRAKGIKADSSAPVTVRILPRHPLVGLYVDGASASSLRGATDSTNEPPGEVDVCPPSRVTPGFDRTPDPDDTYSVDEVNSPDEGAETSPPEDDDGGCDVPDPEKDDCDCAGDEDGTSQCSFRLRISLGSSTPGEVAGFVWTALEEPTAVTPAVFHILGTDAVTSTTNAAGAFTVICSAPAGRTVQVTNIADGVALTVWNASGRLENRWEVTNPWGNPIYVRCRKLTILGNVVSDETFCLYDGMHGLDDVPEDSRVAGVFPDECFTRMDETRGVFTIKSKWYADPAEPDFVTDVHDKIVREDWTSISSVMSEFEKVGTGSGARRRLVRRYGHDEKSEFEENMDYWNDPANPYRHARLRSVRSNRRAWSFHDYDAQGRETVRLEQLDGSPFPDGLAEVSHLAELPWLCSAKATVTSYEPLPGDSCNRNDAFLPRRRDIWVMRHGKDPVLVGTETWLYVRATDANGVALRTCVHSSGVGGTLRSETTVSCPEDDYAVPKHLRGRTVSHTGFDGVTTSSQIEMGSWDATARSFSADPDGAFLRTTTRRTRGGAESETFTVEVQDALRRLVVYSATCHTASNAVLNWSASTYDDIDRLRSTIYSDGTSETNAYSCCRLLWRRDRQGRKVLRSAQTGTDDLYYAEEDVWLADVSTNGHFRVTQHFFDALGRETNTVTYAGTTPGEAAVPLGAAALLPLQSAGGTQLVASVATTYTGGALDGNEYSIRTDERGAETWTWINHCDTYERALEETITNGVYCSSVERTTRRNGATVTRRGWDNPDGSYAWTEETRSTDWLPDGRRVVTVSTTASDNRDASYGYVVVTNSVTTYDLFDRVSTVAVPSGTTGVPPVAGWLVTSNAYDGVSDRILTSTRYAPTLAPRTTTYLYNDLGEQVGTVVADVTNRTDVTYENIGGEWWKVETSAVIGPETNAVSFMRERQTGLSDACRRHVVEIDANGATTETFSATGFFYSLLGTEVETVNSSTGPTVVRYGQHGVIRGIDDEGELKFVFRDAFGREAVKVRVRDDRPLQQFVYNPFGDLIEMLTCTNDWEMISESYAYDMFGNRIATTDALGNTVYKSYDPFGHVVAEWGATYPVRYTYDTAGRRTSLSTTRNGTTWDTTSWTYDFRSGLCTSKTYVDGSVVTYTYTPDKLLLRTTYPSGKWKENVYDAQRRLCGVVYSSTNMDYELQLDAYGNATNVVDAAGNNWRYDYGFNSKLLREEFANTGGPQLVATATTNNISRSYDSFDRPTGFAFSVNGVAKGGVGYSYDGDGLVCGLVATNSAGRTLEVEYGNDYGYNYGYGITINGDDFVPFYCQITRDEYRRNLVTSTSAYLQGLALDERCYEYDALARPTACIDTSSWYAPSVYANYSYNSRNEVVFAAIGMNVFAHDYDAIGNHTLFAANAATNTFTHNQLNQMVGRVTPSMPPTVFTYAPDGGLASDGLWAYAYDAEDQLLSVTSSSLTNGAARVLNSYDYRRRRVGKTVERYADGCWNATEIRSFVYDGWNLIHEAICTVNGTTTNATEVQYFWGPDISGTLQGAGGVGGLIAVSRDGQFYFPVYDNNGNILKYSDEMGNVVAAYEYDDFGRIISQSGSLADFFRYRFSTKYFDADCELYYYDYRHYKPEIMAWLTEDPVGVDGGANLYAFCENMPVCTVDPDGLTKYWDKYMNFDDYTSGDVWKQVGGNLYWGYLFGTYHNSCALRVSRSLILNGHHPKKGTQRNVNKDYVTLKEIVGPDGITIPKGTKLKAESNGERYVISAHVIGALLDECLTDPTIKRLSWKSEDEANRLRACIEKENGEAFFAANGHTGMIKKGYKDDNFPYRPTGRIWRIK